MKWICGFANAQGGSLVLGKDDKGHVKGLANARKLLEDIPNKVRDMLGVMVEVNLRQDPMGEYLEIVVEPYPYPINVRGRYYFRTGSTNQELKGAALDKFLLGKQGRKWDGVPVPEVTMQSLSQAAIDIFRRNASKSQREQSDTLNDEVQVLLQKLHLTEGKLLKRAAVLLFHPNPENFFTGSYVKIGFFQKDDQLLFQDTVHGSLFEQIEQVLDLLLTKYLRAKIRYQGLTRIEEYPIPITALREALLNALAHKAYESAIPIQISVYDDRLVFWNAGQLPDDWTVDDLKVKHPSAPYNPDIAGTFFRAGLIEAWGIGTIKIIHDCSAAKLPPPQFQATTTGFTVYFRFSKPSPKTKADKRSIFGAKALESLKLAYANAPKLQELPNVPFDEFQMIVSKLDPKSLAIALNLKNTGPCTRKEIMNGIGLSNQTNNVNRYFAPLLLARLILPTIQDRPNSKNQQYNLTEVGELILQLSQKVMKSQDAN